MSGMLGRQIEGFVVEKALPPMGHCYAVRHPQHGAALLRLYGAPPGGPDPALFQRLCALRHRNLCQVFAAGLLEGGEGRLYMIQERPPGETAAERMSQAGPLDVAVALEVLAQATAGLSALHQAGFSHGVLSTHSLYLLWPAEGDDSGDLVKLIGPDLPVLLGDRGAGAVSRDLVQLGGVFQQMLTGPAPLPPALASALRRALGEDVPRCRSALEFYAAIDAAVRRSGVLGEEDSQDVTLPMMPPPAMADPLATVKSMPARRAAEEEGATVEMERMDPGDVTVPPWQAPAQSLADLVGPLERRGPEPAETAPSPRVAGALPERPRKPLSSSQDTARNGCLLASLWAGPGRWLLPLGLCTLLTLGLAVWVLWRHGH